MAERKLGRGLDSLLGQARPVDGEEVRKIALGQVEPGRFQPRQEFASKELQELASSIEQNGLLQPIIVRPGGAGYEIVAGERRWRAAKLAGLDEIPAIVRRYDDEQALVLALVENVQRTDLNPIDKAQAYRRLSQQLGQTHEEVAKRLGLDRSSVSNMIRLLGLPEEVRELVRQRALSMGHARALLGLADDADQLRVAEKIVRDELSVRATESLVRQDKDAPPTRRTSPRKTPQVMALEDELRALLGTKVKIIDKRGKGRIQIEYYSSDEFQRLLEKLRGESGFSRNS